MKSINNKSVSEEIKSRIQKLSEDDEPIFGSMNVKNAVCHLIDGLRAPFDEENNNRFKPSFFSTKLGQWFVVSSPIPWPKGKIKIEPELEPVFFNTKPSESFEKDKETLINEIDNFISNNNEELASSPVFGKLSSKQWGKLQYRHLNHHLEQFGR